MPATHKHVPTKQDQSAADRSIRRIKQLMLEDELTQADMVKTLNDEGYLTIRLKPWTALNIRQVIWKIRHQEPSWYGLSSRRAGLVIETLQ